MKVVVTRRRQSYLIIMCSLRFSGHPVRIIPAHHSDVILSPRSKCWASGRQRINASSKKSCSEKTKKITVETLIWDLVSPTILCGSGNYNWLLKQTHTVLPWHASGFHSEWGSIGAGTGGAGGAAAPPTKLLGEQVIHPAPQLFSVLFQIFWATSHTLVIAESMAVRKNSSR